MWRHFSLDYANLPRPLPAPSLVTVQKCDGRDLGSTSLKMAAGSTLNGAVKYVYPDRHFVGGKRTNKLHSRKRRENMGTEATDVTVVPETWRRCGHQKVVPKHVDKTCRYMWYVVRASWGPISSLEPLLVAQRDHETRADYVNWIVEGNEVGGIPLHRWLFWPPSWKVDEQSFHFEFSINSF